MKINLTEMKTGEKGVVADIEGGEAFIKKITNMGLRKGSTAQILSRNIWCGPLTVRIGRTRIAIGYGMAKKILVEVKRGK